jgi:hypothetical protein
MQHHVDAFLGRRMIVNPKPSKEFVVLVGQRRVVIMRHHAEQRRLAKPARTQEKQVLAAAQVALELAARTASCRRKTPPIGESPQSWRFRTRIPSWHHPRLYAPRDATTVPNEPQAAVGGAVSALRKPQRRKCYGSVRDNGRAVGCSLGAFVKRREQPTISGPQQFDKQLLAHGRPNFYAQ